MAASLDIDMVLQEIPVKPCALVLKKLCSSLRTSAVCSWRKRHQTSENQGESARLAMADQSIRTGY